MSAATRQLPDESATEALGAALQRCRPAFGSVWLTGDLGAGKTTLVRGLLRAAGYRGAVRSPTYTLVETYELGDTPLYHLDLYRLSDPEELEFIGLREFVDTGLMLVEWPMRGVGVLPAPALSIHLAHTESGRLARLVTEHPDWPLPDVIIQAIP
jgi:tRNA threonylcarbamoyladenosine biosynthesis protein TsaE